MAIEALLVLLLLVSPGLIADGLYRFLLWRHDPGESARLVRSLLFSSVSLLVLLGLADLPPDASDNTLIPFKVNGIKANPHVPVHAGMAKFLKEKAARWSADPEIRLASGRPQECGAGLCLCSGLVGCQ
jgi:hypothetical protein